MICTIKHTRLDYRYNRFEKCDDFIFTKPVSIQIEGALYGDISLLFNMTIAGESAQINMHTGYQPAVFSMPGKLLNIFTYSH